MTVLFAADGAAQQRAGAGVIDTIAVEGNRNVSTETILKILQIKEGDAFDAQAVSDGIKRLFATKKFSDVKAYREGTTSVVLTVVVKEHIMIDAVRFSGNKKLKDDELEEATLVQAGSFVRPSLVRQDMTKIQELYKEKGYYRARVKDRIDTDTDGSGRRITLLEYEITEGEKVKIRHIDFFGNRIVDSDVIRNTMESEEKGFLSSSEFKPKVLEEDLQRIETLYREHGFLDARVIDRELIFSENGKDLDIFVTLEEGKRYSVGEIDWNGNELFPDWQIRNLITLHEGQVFNDTEFTNIQVNISSLYWDRGYIYSSVSPQKTVRDDVIDLHFEISEGDPAHIHEINITGNTKTHEEVIRRQLTVTPGEIFLRPKLLRSLREIFNLGYFEGPPEVSTAATENGDIDITLDVTEKQTGQFRLGAGFSALNSISGFFGMQEQNFLGRGQQVGINWEFSRTRQNVDLRFTEPWLYGTPTQFSINVFNRVQNQVSQQFYDDRRRGVSLSLGRPFPWFDYTSVFLRYRWEQIELSNFSPFYAGPLLSTNWPQTTSSMALTLSRNSTDNPFRATRGTRTSFTAEATGGVLGGDVRFHSYEAGFSWFNSLLRSLVLEMRYQVAFEDGFTSPAQVPDYELYRLGGNQRYGVRGYDFFEIVPEGNPTYLGGRFMQIVSYEVTLPIAPTVFAVGFFDAGNTWNSFRGADIFNLRKGAGIGIRIDLPMLGRMGFDYGYGFDKPAGAGWEPHISLGAGF